MTGTAEVGGQRRHRKVHATSGRKKTGSGATRNYWAQKRLRAIRVIVAARDASNRGKKVPRSSRCRTQSSPESSVTGYGECSILGTGSGKAKPTAVQSGNRHATPLGERSRRNCRDQPSVCHRSKGTEQAERTEAGPGLKQIAHRIGPKQKRPTR